jgi:hypothetical protein
MGGVTYYPVLPSYYQQRLNKAIFSYQTKLACPISGKAIIKLQILKIVGDEKNCNTCFDTSDINISGSTE